MPLLSQVVAAEKGVKGRVGRDVTDLYHSYQRSTSRLEGLTRVYNPRHEDGDPLPQESTPVQVKLWETLALAGRRLTELFDVTATKDYGNLSASADVVVDGKALLAEVPVTYLLFLGKQLEDLHTVLHALPTLDPAYTWTYSANAGVYRTPEVGKVKTRKTPRNHVKAEATDRHPAQVEVYYEDLPIGDWAETKSSGALPAATVRELVERVEALQTAVKYARERANATEIANQKVGETVFTWLFAPLGHH